MIHFKPTFYAISLLLIITSCKKEETSPDPETPNTKAKITVDHIAKTIEEGKDIILGISLSEKIKKEIAVDLKIISDTVINFINPEDYKPIFAFSADQGKTWINGSSSQINIPKETKEIQLRLQTIDDNHLEVHEDFYLEIKVVTPEGITLSGDLHVTKKISLLDNEKEIVTKNQDWLLQPVTFIYRTNDDYTEFKLIKMIRKAIIREEKILFDQYISQGLPLNDQKTLRNLYKDGPYHVREIGINLRPSISWAMEVTSEGAFDEWSIVFGSFYLYYETKNDEGKYIKLEIPLNADPNYQNSAYTEIHEYGHVITTDPSMLIHDETSDDPRVPPAAGCQELLSYAGCVKNNSLFAKFFNEFYYTEEGSLDPIPKKDISEPAFVTEYATTHFVEDLAESFSFFITNKDLPTSIGTNSGAYKKIHFFSKFPEVEAYKQKMWEATGGFSPQEFNYGQVNKFNKLKNLLSA